VTIYVPTEGGMPVPTLQMNKWTVSTSPYLD
jgi:hypothetical protein